jgi:predicted nucleotidyltransferase
MRDLRSWHTNYGAIRQLLKRCRDAIQTVVPDAEVILFGSRARGEAQPDSDMDLMILVDRVSTAGLERKILETIYPIQLESGVMISFLVESRHRWESRLYRAIPIVQAVERDGVRS